MKQHSCINCHTDFEGKFCPECGQEIGIRPGTFGFLINSVFKALDLERGMIVTFIHLFIKPAEVIDQFLAGNTRKYSNPIQYLLVATTMTFLFFFNRDNWVLYLRSGLLLLIMFVSNYIFSRRHTSFYGHLMIALYQVGQISFLFLISALVGPMLVKMYGAIEAIGLKYIVFIAYPVWSSVKMFHLRGQKVLLFMLFILFNVNLCIYLWYEFIVQQKHLGAYLNIG